MAIQCTIDSIKYDELATIRKIINISYATIYKYIYQSDFFTFVVVRILK